MSNLCSCSLRGQNTSCFFHSWIKMSGEILYLEFSLLGPCSFTTLRTSIFFCRWCNLNIIEQRTHAFSLNDSTLCESVPLPWILLLTLYPKIWTSPCNLPVTWVHLEVSDYFGLDAISLSMSCQPNQGANPVIKQAKGQLISKQFMRGQTKPCNKNQSKSQKTEIITQWKGLGLSENWGYCFTNGKCKPKSYSSFGCFGPYMPYTLRVPCGLAHAGPEAALYEFFYWLIYPVHHFRKTFINKCTYY